MGYQVLRSAAVQAALHDHLERRLKVEGARLAVDTMIELAKSAPPGVRFSAAKWLAEAAGYGAKDAGPGDKPIGEMTAGELATLADQLEKRIRDGETPVVALSSPDTGRIPPMGDGDTLIDQ